jgi:hypothetical protein
MKMLESRKRSLVEAAEQADPTGICIELGVMNSRSLRILRNYFPGDIYGCDSFEGLPEEWRPGFPAGSFATQPQYIEGTTLIIGLFQDTFPEWLPTLTKPVTLIHVDCDLYSSTIYALNAIEPYMAHGVVILFDEYHNYPGWEDHEHKAFQEFLEAHPHWRAEAMHEVEKDEQKCFRLYRN